MSRNLSLTISSICPVDADEGQSHRSRVGADELAPNSRRICNLFAGEGRKRPIFQGSLPVFFPPNHTRVKKRQQGSRYIPPLSRTLTQSPGGVILEPLVGSLKELGLGRVLSR